MSTMQAWQYITENWNNPQWQAIPQNVQSVLGLDSRLGMSGGMLVTRNGANRITEFVAQMNHKQNRGKIS